MLRASPTPQYEIPHAAVGAVSPHGQRSLYALGDRLVTAIIHGESQRAFARAWLANFWIASFWISNFMISSFMISSFLISGFWISSLRVTS